MKEHIETVREALTASAALTEAIGTCHVCKGALCLDDDPPHCEDCSWDCDEHDEPNCTPMHALRMACNTPAGLDALAKIEAEHERVTTALKWITAEKHSAQVAEEQVRNENYRLLQERDRAEERLTKYFRADPKQAMAGVLDEALQAALDAARDQGKAMADDALRARVEQLEGTLRELRCETLEMEPDAWGIKCIEDHNAIIDEALAAPEQKEPAQPPAPTWQPIETAPLNGRIILTFAVVDTDTGNWNMRLSWWRELRNDEGSHWMKWAEWCQPTHWMPLPAPPAADLLSRIREGE